MVVSSEHISQDALEKSKEMNDDELGPVPSNPSLGKLADSEITPMDFKLGAAVSLLCGVLGFFVFGQMTFSFVFLRVIWPTDVFMSILGGSEYSMAALVTILMLPVNSLRGRYIYIACTMYIACSFFVPIIASTFPGMENFEMARGLLVGVSLVTGAADTLVMVSGLSIAASLPKHGIIIYSGGCALSSAVPWGIYMLFSQAIFPKTREGQTKALWASFSFTVVISIALLICTFLLCRRPWFKAVMMKGAIQHRSQFAPGESRWKKIFLMDSAANLQQTSINETKDSDAAIDVDVSTKESNKVESAESEELGPAREFLSVAKDFGPQVINAFVLIFTTMLLYPTIAPYGFRLNDFWTGLLCGIGHVCHTFLRFAPAFCPWMMVNPKALLPAIIVRACIFIPLIIVINRIPGIPFISNVWFLVVMCILFAFSFGLGGTLTDIYALDSVKHPQEKTLALKILIIFQLLGSSMGQFTSGRIAAPYVAG